jgi:hypothetical protein
LNQIVLSSTGCNATIVCISIGGYVQGAEHLKHDYPRHLRHPLRLRGGGGGGGGGDSVVFASSSSVVNGICSSVKIGSFRIVFEGSASVVVAMGSSS